MNNTKSQPYFCPIHSFSLLLLCVPKPFPHFRNCLYTRMSTISSPFYHITSRGNSMYRSLYLHCLNSSSPFNKTGFISLFLYLFWSSAGSFLYYNASATNSVMSIAFKSALVALIASLMF